MTTPKVPGTFAGELLRDLNDERLLAAHPRPTGMDDVTYMNRLAHQGFAIVLPRAELAAGAYARTKAKAIVNGQVVLVPYDEDETRPEHAFGEGLDAEPFDYVAWRAQYDKDQSRSRYERHNDDPNAESE